jgi:hypothetical protein
MNVLILEDRGSVSVYLEQALKEQGHMVFSGFSVRDAQKYWDDEQVECIIAGLSMNPEGLTDEEVTQTKGGLLTGWIWLKNYVFKTKEEMRSRTIIYSNALDTLKASCKESELAGVHLASKRRPGGTAEVLLRLIDAISALPVRERQGGADPGARGISTGGKEKAEEEGSLALYFDLSEFDSNEIHGILAQLSSLYAACGGDHLVIDDVTLLDPTNVLEPVGGDK